MEFFAFADIEREVEQRLVAESTSMATHVSGLKAMLLDMTLSPATRGRLWSVLDGFEGGVLSRRFDAHYRKHAIRVCAIIARHSDLDLDAGWLELALLHNAIEAGSGIGGLESYLPADILDGVELLTIDRSRERDDTYLSAYYAEIAAAGDGLLVLKATDKLDNHLSYVRLDLDAHHFRVVDDFLCPVLERRRPDLARYLRTLTAFSQRDENRRRFAAKFPDWTEDR